MTRVLTPLDLRYIDGDRWLVLVHYACESEVLGRIDIPAGFITDFNSTPRGLWNLFPPAEYAEASLPHDKLYRFGEHHGKPITRKQADRVHREFLRFKQAPAWKIRTMYYGLRLFGWFAWRRYRHAGS